MNPIRRTAVGLASITSSLLLLSACSITGFGASSSLTCKLPDGARCDSVSNTYSESTKGMLPGQIKRRGMEEPDGSAPAPSGTSQRSGAAVPTYIDARLTQTTMPLRSQPRIARVWIKPWEDADGDLHDQSFVYLPVDEGRWMVDHKQREVREAYAPARTPRPVVPEQKAALPGAPGSTAASNSKQQKLAELARRVQPQLGNGAAKAAGDSSGR